MLDFFVKIIITIYSGMREWCHLVFQQSGTNENKKNKQNYGN